MCAIQSSSKDDVTAASQLAASNKSPIEIRQVKGLSELRAVEDLQKEVWRCSDREIVPSLALVPLLEIGGVLIGGFQKNELIAFVLGFPGIENDRPILHSEMLAVKREFRSSGLGYRLKLAQREKALQKGIDKITWTFDPLQSLNAHLNFSRLGVISDRYKVNYYGQTSSFLHRTGTDRLWVSWLLNSERVKRKLEGATNLPDVEGAATVLAVSDTGEPVLNQDIAKDRLILEIPGDVNELMRKESDIAIRWREASRQAFSSVLDAGYTLVDFYRSERKGRAIGSYLGSILSSSKPAKQAKA
ncbi:MAG TPA: GNAT family N-acetyltransferase [Pyrinomonadaceae bacterium]|nr:GNAT family N-acetyltransferase [Pyrinomonadaceae bacterium]